MLSATLLVFKYGLCIYVRDQTMTRDKPPEHDTWEYNDDEGTMEKFGINDKVTPVRPPLSEEAASWGPRQHDMPPENATCRVINTQHAKIFGRNKEFHQVKCRGGDRYERFTKTFLASDLKAANGDE